MLAGLRLEHETVKAEHTSLQAELEATKAAVELAETTNTSVKREELAMVTEAEAKTDALIAEHAKTAEEVATAVQAGTAEMEAVMVKLDAANSELKLSNATVEAEIAKGVQADTLIKSLDLKLTNLRKEMLERDAQVAALTETATDATQRCGEALLEAKQAKRTPRQSPQRPPR